MAGVAALVSDLIFSSKIVATAKAAGVEFKIVRSTAALEGVWGMEPAVLLVDLEVAGDDPILAIKWVKMWDKPVQIVAFGSHVQVDRLQAAKEAGADMVLARSAFVKQLPELIAAIGQKEKEASV